MTDEERHAPDSLRGKLDSLLGDDRDTATDGSTKLDNDAGSHVPTDADEPPMTSPKRPTDPPF